MHYKEDCFHLGVKALIQNSEGKLLLLQKNNKNSQHLWDLPGGRIHRKELLEDALKREVYEETGLNHLAHISPFMMVLTPHRIPLPEGDVGLIFAVYLCHTLEDPSTVRLSDEHLSYTWVLPEEAAEWLAPNHSPDLTQKISQLSVQMGTASQS